MYGHGPLTRMFHQWPANTVELPKKFSHLLVILYFFSRMKHFCHHRLRITDSNVQHRMLWFVNFYVLPHLTGSSGICSDSIIKSPGLARESHIVSGHKMTVQKSSGSTIWQGRFTAKHQNVTRVRGSFEEKSTGSFPVRNLFFSSRLHGKGDLCTR